MPQRMYLLHRHSQQGVALFVVLVFVMLSMLLALWASRTSLFNEMVVGNDADYQRAFEAAQALMQDAEMDIRRERADGSKCSGSGAVCRTGGVEQIPVETPGLTPLLATLENRNPRCKDGLCMKRTAEQDFWNDATTLTAMKTEGVRYGTYTGAQLGDNSAPANPILQETDSDKGGWYWIEVLPYTADAANAALVANGASNFLPLNLQPNVVYRITALAQGRKDSTQVVLQQTYARHKLMD